MIDVDNLSKLFGETRAVDGVSFQVNSGEVLGFLGPNGAGKTTTMRVITCYLQPSGGTVRIDGLDVTEQSIEVRRRIGYLPESAPLYHEMNVVDYLHYVAEIRHVPKSGRRGAVRRAVERCGLEDVIRKTVGQLSSGYRQRLGLAQAILHDPEILVLDEPTRGLDPNQIAEIRQLIRDIGRQKTVIFSTHILQEVRAVCDRVMIIDRGKIKFDGSKEALAYAASGKERVFVEVRSTGDAGESLRRLPQVEAVRIVSQKDGITQLHVESEQGKDLRADIFGCAVQNGWTLLELRRETEELEDVFRKLTTSD